MSCRIVKVLRSLLDSWCCRLLWARCSNSTGRSSEKDVFCAQGFFNKYGFRTPANLVQKECSTNKVFPGQFYGELSARRTVSQVSKIRDVQLTPTQTRGILCRLIRNHRLSPCDMPPSAIDPDRAGRFQRLPSLLQLPNEILQDTTADLAPFLTNQTTSSQLQSTSAKALLLDSLVSGEESHSFRLMSRRVQSG